MCMKPIRHVDVLFKRVLDVIQASTESHIGECGVGGRTQVNRRNGLPHILSLGTVKCTGVGYGQE